jgi:hypothetical protein
MKEFCTVPNCSDSELGAKVNAGWDIKFMQFGADGKLNVVFVRDVPVAATPAPSPCVDIVPVTSTRSIALTKNTYKPGDTRPVNVPAP